MSARPNPAADRRRALLAASGFAEAAKALFDLAKAARKTVSLASLCTRIGLKSRGHLSEILAGKRTLDGAKVGKLGEALGLKGPEIEFFALLHAQATDDPRMQLLRRVLSAAEPEAPARLGEMFLAFKVFAAFSLFGDRPTRDQLVDFFGKANCQDVDRSLALLVDEGLVSIEGKSFAAHFEHVIFRNDGTGFSLRDYLHMSLDDARRTLERWVNARDVANYQASIISVRRSDLLRILPEIKARLREEQSRLESDKGDMLVHFNVQIYPVEP